MTSLSTIVKAELVYGAQRSSRAAENLRLLDRFFEPFVSYPFDDACVGVYGRLRTDMERLGTPIGPYDLMIAAVAIANDCTLVTANMREFVRVVGLDVENWEASG